LKSLGKGHDGVPEVWGRQEIGDHLPGKEKDSNQLAMYCFWEKPEWAWKGWVSVML